MEPTGRIRMLRSSNAAIDPESLSVAMLDGWDASPPASERIRRALPRPGQV